MSDILNDPDRFTRYLDATVGRPPRATLLAALDLFERPGLAVDLGCGAGRDTLPLLQRGWRVIAIDSNAEAIRRLNQAAGDDPNLEAREEAFEDATWPAAELVNSSFALPFCQPAKFDALWHRIVASLKPGGAFAGQLFGPNDGFAAPGVTTLTRAQVDAMLAGLQVVQLEEIEEDGKTATGRAKHWHLYHVVARKPEAG